MQSDRPLNRAKVHREEGEVARQAIARPRDEARRIAAIIAKLPEPVRQPYGWPILDLNQSRSINTNVFGSVAMLGDLIGLFSFSLPPEPRSSEPPAEAL